jgi:hypothetical protein
MIQILVRVSDKNSITVLFAYFPALDPVDYHLLPIEGMQVQVSRRGTRGYDRGISEGL